MQLFFWKEIKYESYDIKELNETYKWLPFCF